MRVQNERLRLDITEFGGMISAAELVLDDARVVRPFFENPWREDARIDDPFVRNLGSEWVCVPFGLADAPGELPEDWRLTAPDQVDWNDVIHGFGSHADWKLSQTSSESVHAQIEYPLQSPVARLERQIELQPGSSRINFSFTVHARRDAKVGLGVHPVFNLQGLSACDGRIIVDGDDAAWSFPVDVEPGRSRFAADQRAVSLREMKDVSGAVVDATRVPLDSRTEDLLLLTSTNGQVRLELPNAGYSATVSWDASELPSCALWYSNRGRDYAPWDGRVCAIGIEPVAAAFNLGQPHNVSPDTPLAHAGVRTAVQLTEGAGWTTNYSIEFESFPASAADIKRGKS